MWGVDKRKTLPDATGTLVKIINSNNWQQSVKYSRSTRSAGVPTCQRNRRWSFHQRSSLMDSPTIIVDRFSNDHRWSWYSLKRASLVVIIYLSNEHRWSFFQRSSLIVFPTIIVDWRCSNGHRWYLNGIVDCRSPIFIAAYRFSDVTLSLINNHFIIVNRRSCLQSQMIIVDCFSKEYQPIGWTHSWRAFSSIFLIYCCSLFSFPETANRHDYPNGQRSAPPLWPVTSEDRGQPFQISRAQVLHTPDRPSSTVYLIILLCTEI